MADFSQVVAQGSANRGRLIQQLLGQQQEERSIADAEKRALDRALLSLNVSAAEQGIDLGEAPTLRDALSAFREAQAGRIEEVKSERARQKRLGTLDAARQLSGDVQAAAGSATGETSAAEQSFLSSVAPMVDPDDQQTLSDVMRILETAKQSGAEQRRAQQAGQKEQAGQQLQQTRAEAQARADVQLDLDRKQFAMRLGMDEGAKPAEIAAEIRARAASGATAESLKIMRMARREQGKAIEGFYDDLDKLKQEFDPTQPEQMARVKTIISTYGDSDTFPLLVKLPKARSFAPDTTGWALFQGGAADLAHWMPVIQAEAAKGDPVFMEMYGQIAQHPGNTAVQGAVGLLQAHKKSGKPLPPPESSPEGTRAILNGTYSDQLAGDFRELIGPLKGVGRAIQRLDPIAGPTTGIGKRAAERKKRKQAKPTVRSGSPLDRPIDPSLFIAPPKPTPGGDPGWVFRGGQTTKDRR